MPAMMPARSTHMSHNTTTQADLDLLSLLTSDQSTLGPLSGGRGHAAVTHTQEGKKKVLPRRDSPMDALMISAVIAGSGPVTRHHFGHGMARPGAYASCDESRPTSPTHENGTFEAHSPPKVIMKSTQAPRSERLRLEREAREAALNNNTSKDSALSTSPTSAMNIPRHPSDKGTTSPLSSSFGNKDRPRRKMSMDPTPVTQTLQKASPVNYFHPNSTGIQSPPLMASTSASASARPKVRCMARTRVPTPHGEVFLHLYHNSHDMKEHLAIVIDPIQLDPQAKAAAPRRRKEIRSKSLDEKWREGETEMERLVRGAYTGRLRPGAEGGRIEEETDGDDVEMSQAEQEVGIDSQQDVKALIRIHSECYTGETIGSMRCDCGEQLDEALRSIAEPQPLLAAKNPTHTTTSPESPGLPTPVPSRPETPAEPTYVPGRGVVIYMRQEGRGIGLLEKIRAYNLQDLGHDTVTANLMLGHGADERKYDVAAEILRDLGLADEGVRLLTNNPEKVEGLGREGVKISERVGMVPRDWTIGHGHGHGLGLGHSQGILHGAGAATMGEEEKEYEDWRLRRAGVGLIGAGKASGPELEKYLRTKVERMGHMIDIPDKV
ncbi:GTP cyclohydrolase II [Kwoniella shandongensis]|uniref:GTP cyclohydrolase II n=1 Tax=Kwoniella shandongensis TaxID=1734106 RepID=A0A5M6C5W3_9TREE|nr:GTP cyclohydrolase II [Kwoniella shandongensis]KAA5530130.1 GTP cyclohydrolase II [Kwoniella shandongensis]